MSTAYALAQALHAARVGEFAGSRLWSISVGVEPESPDDCITLYDLPGTVDTDEMDVVYAEVQIRVRSSRYLAAWNKANEIRGVLDSLGPMTFEGMDIRAVSTSQSPGSIGPDDSDRSIITSVFTVLQQGR